MTELNNFFSDFKQVCAKCNSMICSCQEENPINKWINKIHQGNVIDLARQLPNESINLIITSPPYWNLRNYGTQPQIWETKECEHQFGDLIHNQGFGEAGNKEPSGFQQNANVGKTGALSQVGWSDSNRGQFCKLCQCWKGELGSEPDPIHFVKHLVDVFESLKPKLRKDGTLWVNLGDSYYGGNGGPQSFERESRDIKWNEQSIKNPHRKDKSKYSWMQPKQLMLIPSRFAIAMQDAGWILRNDLIWKKENAMPTSVNDRFKPSYEHIFFFVKSRRYFFDLDSIREPHKTSLKSLQNRIDYDTKLQEREINPLGTVPPDSWKYNEFENEGNNTKSIKERMAYARRVEGKEHDSAINHPLGKTPEDVMKYKTGYEGGRKLRKSPNDAFHPAGKTPDDVYNNFTKNHEGMKRLNTLSADEKMHPLGGTPDDFFSVNTQPHPFSHFAVFPVELIRKPILAGSPKEICSKCGTPRYPIIKTEFITYTLNYTKCKCKENDFVGSIVLDPFGGSGTTAIASEQHGRRWILFELQHDYIKIAEQRLKDYHQSLKYSDIEDFKEIQKLKKDAVKTKPLMNFYE